MCVCVTSNTRPSASVTPHPTHLQATRPTSTLYPGSRMQLPHAGNLAARLFSPTGVAEIQVPTARPGPCPLNPAGGGAASGHYRRPTARRLARAEECASLGHTPAGDSCRAGETDCCCCENTNAHTLRTPKHGGRNRNGRRRGRHSLLLSVKRRYCKRTGR